MTHNTRTMLLLTMSILLLLAIGSIVFAAPTIAIPYARAAALGLAPESVEVDARAVAEKLKLPPIDNAVTLLPDVGGVYAEHLDMVYPHTVSPRVYPEIDAKGNVIAGGTPVVYAGEIRAAYIASVKAEVARRNLPDGSALIFDYESWGPLLPPANSTGTQLAMRTLALKQVEQMGVRPESLEMTAQHLWTVRGRQLHLDTIAAAKSVNPTLRIGFYTETLRDWWQGWYRDNVQSDAKRASNDLWAEVWQAQDIFPVSVYFLYATAQDEAEAGRRGFVADKEIVEYVDRHIREAKRLAPDVPILALIEPAIHPGASAVVREARPSGLITDAEFMIWLDAAHTAGADRVGIWGSAHNATLRTYYTEQLARLELAYIDWVKSKLEAQANAD